MDVRYTICKGVRKMDEKRKYDTAFKQEALRLLEMSGKKRAAHPGSRTSTPLLTCGNAFAGFAV
jgi:hypothetical protein